MVLVEFGADIMAGTMDKKSFSERDICTKFITPALHQAGWDEMAQVREEVSFTKGRIIVRGKLVSRGKSKRADYILYYKPNIPIALIEAKDRYCQVDVERANLSRRADFLCSHRTAQVTSCQTMKARSRSSR